MSYFDATDFDLPFLYENKKTRKIAVIFSTYGEREADLVVQKIALFADTLPGLVDTILLSHRRTTASPDRTELAVRKAARNTDILLCNEYAVPDMGSENGKGADMRRALYYLVTEKQYGDKDIIVYLDSDVVPELFGVHFFYGLVGAVLEGADFAKASFYREMGRVKKYVAQPLFSVIQHPLLHQLADFSYPLSGEVAGTVHFFLSVSYWQLYGVETGVTIDALSQKHEVADVNLGMYDHEHSPDNAIQKMSFGIIRTYLKKLEELGFIEFQNGASVSDIYSYSTIDGEGKRQQYSFDMSEKQYPPLKRII